MNTISAIKTYSDKPDIAAAAIKQAGGPAGFARVIGLEHRWKLQRIDNWRKRGFPVNALIEFPAILPLCDAAQKASVR